MPFYIKNIDTGLVLDIKNANNEPNGKIIMYPYNGGNHQLWEYRNGMIYSLHNDLVLDLDQWHGNTIITYPAHGGNNQQWTFNDDNTIQCNVGHVLDVAFSNPHAGARVVGWEKHGGANQQFVRVNVPDK